MPTNDAAPDSDALCLPVDVEPPEREQLAHPQTADRCGEDDRAVDATEVVLINATEHGLELLRVKETDVLAELNGRSVDVPARVLGCPPVLVANPQMPFSSPTTLRTVFGVNRSRARSAISCSTCSRPSRAHDQSPTRGTS
jgi:hypothetical protein